jgi:hypothetical protein
MILFGKQSIIGIDVIGNILNYDPLDIIAFYHSISNTYCDFVISRPSKQM